MNGETGFLSWRREMPVRGINPRGARHWGAAWRRQTCMRQVRLDPDHDAVMRIGGEAPGGGPILAVGISATSCCGSTPPRIVSQQSGQNQPRVPKGTGCFSLWPEAFQPAGRRMTPSSNLYG